MTSDKDRIITKIRRRGPGSAFTPKDFLDLGTRGTVAMTLASLLTDGQIRRIARGLYDYPRHSERLGEMLSPDPHEVAEALARRYRWKIIPEGSHAANVLGLSTQVPARIVYLSDGPSRTIQIGQLVIRFKNTRPKEMGVVSKRSATVIQALRSLGKLHVGDREIEKLAKQLNNKEKRQLLGDARQSADWILEVAKKIAQEKD